MIGFTTYLVDIYQLNDKKAFQSSIERQKRLCRDFIHQQNDNKAMQRFTVLYCTVFIDLYPVIKLDIIYSAIKLYLLYCTVFIDLYPVIKRNIYCTLLYCIYRFMSSDQMFKYINIQCTLLYYVYCVNYPYLLYFTVLCLLC